jgi:hypothetical protein
MIFDAAGISLHENMMLPASLFMFWQKAGFGRG